MKLLLLLFSLMSLSLIAMQAPQPANPQDDILWQALSDFEEDERVAHEKKEQQSQTLLKEIEQQITEEKLLHERIEAAEKAQHTQKEQELGEYALKELKSTASRASAGVAQKTSAALASLKEKILQPDALKKLQELFKRPEYEWAKNLTENGKNLNATKGDYFGGDSDRYRTALMLAVRNQDVTLIKLFLAAGADPNMPDKKENGDTALILAAEKGNIEILKLLIDAGSELNHQGKKGQTALLAAVANKHIDAVNFLLKAGADPNFIMKKKDRGTDFTVLERAVSGALHAQDANDRLKYKELIKILIDAKATVNMALLSEGSPILELINTSSDKPDHIDVLQLLLRAKPNLNVTVRRLPLLQYAMGYGASSEVIKVLIDAGVDVNAANDEGRTPLMKSLYDEKTFKKLIEAGADVNKKDKKGNTVLMLIASEPLREGKGFRLTNMLLDAGAQIDVQDSEGETALLRAIKAKNDDVIFALLNRKVNLRIENSKGHTAWQWAITMGNSKALEAMLNTSLDVNAQTLGGMTPLRQAIFNNEMGTINMLLDRNASLTMEDGGHRAAWYDIIEQNKPILFKLLLASGLDINAQSSYGKTPLMVAVELNKHEMIAALLNQKTKPNLNLEDSQHFTAWLHAITFNNLPALEKMLSAGLDVNTKNSQGITPLMQAAFMGKLAIVEFLLGQGADIRLTNNDNEKKNALQFALDAGHQDVANMLLDYEKKKMD